MAITAADVDLINKQLTINKSYQRLKKSDIITDPKTPKSNRIIALDDSLYEDLLGYMPKLYELAPGDRIFPSQSSFFIMKWIEAARSQELKE